jgi:uncharacterized SAM-binding protein YcdF (DUF218 family)
LTGLISLIFILIQEILDSVRLKIGMKKFIKPILINPDFVISMVIFLPVLYLTGQGFLILMVYLLTSLILGPLTFKLIHNLERKYEVLHPKGLKNPVLVLGGGHDTIESLPYNQQLTSGALGRMMEGLRVFQESDAKTLVLSGPSLAKDHPTQAEIQSYVLGQICQLNPESILKLNTPTTTEEEAISYGKALGNITPILVTKAIHMHRAVVTFSSMGIDVIPAPCNFIVKNAKQPWSKWLIPAFSQAPYLGELLKESFGLLFLMIRIKVNPKPIFSKV